MPDFKTTGARQFWEYWRSLQGERLVPLKNQFHPGQIRHLLPDLFMLKLEAPDLFRLTLVGTHHTQRCGEELTGANFLDRMPGGSKAAVAQNILQVTSQPVCNHLIIEEMTASGRRTKLEMVQLPLTELNKPPHYIVGIGQELDKHNYDLAPVKTHAHFTQTSMQTYIDIGAGLPQAVPLSAKGARP